MGRELEYKYAATEAAFDALTRRFAPLHRTLMETAYYDTPDKALSAKHWTLRRRMEDAVSVCTFKMPLPDGSRAEWEAQARTIGEGIPLLCQAGAPQSLPDYVPLEQVCGARFTRLWAELILPDAVAELALDRGVLLGGGREEPLLEMEIEYKEGSEEAVRDFARALAGELGLSEEPLSKFARAVRMSL